VPTVARFSTGWIEVDLDDLGDHDGRYQPASPEAIQTALSGPSRRTPSRKPSRAFPVRYATTSDCTLARSPVDGGGLGGPGPPPIGFLALGFFAPRPIGTTRFAGWAFAVRCLLFLRPRRPNQ
jgi:hypothetical protein